ncbi:MAG: hypothetical protein JXA71_19150 [Chitinispirillaceae bacterium]|nr:hypothetical protein [Chitinispirillaceae bacterium]
MALSGMTADYLPRDTTAPSPLPLDEEGNLAVTDPKTLATRQIIERLFSDDQEKKETAAAPRRADTVELSSRAVELFEQRSGKAVITLPDGSSITIAAENTRFVRVEESVAVQSADPLVLDLDNNGLQLTDVRSGGGVAFDLTGDGSKETVSWVSPNDGFLAYDRNGNGVIDSGRELFGDRNGAIDGFAELATYDQDRNGIIDAQDPLFADLRVWQDKNQNGISEAGELNTPGHYGISTLSYRSSDLAHSVAGNLVTGYSRYGTATDSGLIGEAWLNYYT